MKTTNIKFENLDKNTLDMILAQAKKETIDTETFDKVFPLVQDENQIIQFDTGEEVSDFLNNHGISQDEHYKYIFTCVDGEGDELLVLNGWHVCNRLFYVVSTKSWSTGNKEADGNIYIETNY